MNKVIKEYGKLFVETSESSTSKGVPVLDFPNFTRSILQQDNMHLMRTLNITTLIESRRIGKTTSASDYFYQYHIMEGDLMKRGSLSILAHPQAQELYDRFVKNALIQPFGGNEGLLGESLDTVYIKLPKRYREYLFENGNHLEGISHNINEADFEWFFKPYDKEGNSLIVIPNDVDEPYVKLFKDNIGNNVSTKSAEGICRGRLFNGANIELVSANHNFDKYVSGKALNFLWGEELGTWTSNYISKIAIPAVVQRDGKVINTLTPDKKNPDPKQHWTYQDIVLPIMGDKETKHFYKHGLDIYINNKGVETPVEKDGKIVIEEQGRTQGVVIGKLSECFPYSHDNQKYFANVISSLTEVVKPIWKQDENDNYLKSETGTFILEKLIYTGEKKAGSLDMIDWFREYEMSFEGRGTSLCFSSFGEGNIISSTHKEYFEKNFPTIVGFDKGMSLVDEINQTILQKDGSITIFVYIAKVSDNQWVIYDEHMANYDYSTIGKKMLYDVQRNRPIVYDSVLNNAISKIGSTKNNDIYQIGLATPELAYNYRSGLFHRCLIPSHKREKLVKIVEFNKMFEVQNNIINPISHPINKEELGARLYILEHCTQAIEYFKTQRWKTDKEGSFMLKNGEKIPDDTRDDVFDALTYPIDLHNIGIQSNSRKPYKQILDIIWKDTRLSLNNNFKQHTAYQPSYNVTVFGQKNTNTRIW